ncbi:MAG: hypothetical protein ACYDCO_04325 [Armatimonadota bacterium]
MLRHRTNGVSVMADAKRHGLTQIVSRVVLWVLVISGWSLSCGNAIAAPSIVEHANEPIVATCKTDLAQRLRVKVDEVQVIEMQATTWPDASLGIPEMDKLYAQVQTPGWKIILEAQQTQYLYTANAHAYKYGGPVPLWSFSMLYLLPTPNEPNLNGDLYQCSLMGTNHLRVASGVTAYYPQADGVVLFTRRTSRSSHELLMVNAKYGYETTRLYSAFAFGAAAMQTAQETWAAYVRPRVGATWQIVIARIGLDGAHPQTLPLPAGVQPGGIAWSGDHLVILVNNGKANTCYQISPNADTPEWTVAAEYTFPGVRDYMLNKSETLQVDEVKKDGKPAIEVARVWFTGDRNSIVTITNTELLGYDALTLRNYDHNISRYLFVWGKTNGQSAAYTVDIATGQVTPGYSGMGQDIKPFAYAPHSAPYRIVMRE